jgi:hypothetical protein
MFVVHLGLIPYEGFSCKLVLQPYVSLNAKFKDYIVIVAMLVCGEA